MARAHWRWTIRCSSACGRCANGWRTRAACRRMSLFMTPPFVGWQNTCRSISTNLPPYRAWARRSSLGMVSSSSPRCASIARGWRAPLPRSFRFKLGACYVSNVAKLIKDRSQDKRRRIEAAALALFTTQGFHGTNNREIAKRAGVSTAAIYTHYPSKEALFTGLVEEHRALVAKWLRKTIAGLKDPLAKPDVTA